MHEKDLGIAVYLDLYGNILEERQLQIMDMYFNEDYSLSEISEITGITRQGVGESVRKSTRRLREMEEKLHLKERIERFEAEKNAIADEITALFEDNSCAFDFVDRIKKLTV